MFSRAIFSDSPILRSKCDLKYMAYTYDIAVHADWQKRHVYYTCNGIAIFQTKILKYIMSSFAF